jgi:hypothetical protein
MPRWFFESRNKAAPTKEDEVGIGLWRGLGQMPRGSLLVMGGRIEALTTEQ